MAWNGRIAAFRKERLRSALYRPLHPALNWLCAAFSAAVQKRVLFGWGFDGSAMRHFRGDSQCCMTNALTKSQLAIPNRMSIFIHME